MPCEEKKSSVVLKLSKSSKGCSHVSSALEPSCGVTTVCSSSSAIPNSGSLEASTEVRGKQPSHLVIQEDSNVEVDLDQQKPCEDSVAAASNDNKIIRDEEQVVEEGRDYEDVDETVIKNLRMNETVRVIAGSDETK